MVGEPEMKTLEESDEYFAELGAAGYYDEVVIAKFSDSVHLFRYYFTREGDEIGYVIPLFFCQEDYKPCVFEFSRKWDPLPEITKLN